MFPVYTITNHHIDNEQFELSRLASHDIDIASLSLALPANCPAAFAWAYGCSSKEVIVR
jgi:hypothetical protein